MWETGRFVEHKEEFSGEGCSAVDDYVANMTDKLNEEHWNRIIRGYNLELTQAKKEKKVHQALLTCRRRAPYRPRSPMVDEP
jgi:tRNA A-37 threonylcarbamoyl transferase component Bud32